MGETNKMWSKFIEYKLVDNKFGRVDLENTKFSTIFVAINKVNSNFII